MESAHFRVNEAATLAALHELQVLDTAAEEQFDALARAASALCEVPIALISLVDADRQWFKANVGLPTAQETPRTLAFCAHAVLGDGLFEVPDASQDARFSDNPLVAGHPDIRFYAGMPLRLPDGECIGTLCVIDRIPRALNDTQRQVLAHLASATVQALLQRRMARDHSVSQSRYRALVEDQSELVSLATPAGELTFANGTYARAFGRTPEDLIGTSLYDHIPAAEQAAVRAHLHRVCQSDAPISDENQMLQADGGVRWVCWTNRAIRDADGQVVGVHSVGRDDTARRAAEAKLAAKTQRMANILDGTHAGTWEWNINTGEVHLNEHWADIVGCTLAQLAPISIDTWTGLIHPDDGALAHELLAQHFTGASLIYECELRMRHRAGHWVWVYARGRVLSWLADGRPEWMFGTHLDITARKHSEVALLESRQTLQRTGELAQAGAWEYDLATQMVSWSDLTCQLHGMPVGYHPRMADLQRFCVGDSWQRTQQALTDTVHNGAPLDVEFGIKRADGALRQLRLVGTVEHGPDGPARLVGALQDVTERWRLNQALAEQHELLRVTLQSIGDAVITTDASGEVTWLNPAAERMTGWSATEAEGRPITHVFNIVNEETRAPTENPVATCLQQGKIVGLANHTLLISRDGAEYGIEDSAAPIRNQRGEVLGAVLVFHDVSEQRRLSGEMTHRATHDALTGLINRTEFEARLLRVLHKAHEDHNDNALLYIDLDQFKLVNDACGHAIGDQLLQQVGKLFGDAIRSRDTLARLGGDEFAIILEHCNIEQAQRVAQKICDAMEQFRFIHDERRFRIGASIGLVLVDRRWSSTAAIQQAADTSCYAAKEAGRNRVHTWFDTDLAMRARQFEMQWTSRIERALDEDGFVLFAQRLLPLKPRQQGVHAEVLLRLVNPDGSHALPGAFLPAAERFHLASRVDRWVLKHAVAWLSSLPSLDSMALLSVNLSGQSVGDRAFHAWARDMLHTAGPSVCGKLCLEITETAAVTNLADAAVFIDNVRAAGVKVALDDFGAGASSFGYLKTLAVDCLKIDGQFIRNLVGDPLNDAAVRCFTDVARVMGLRTVAEFVDQPATLDRLREIGVDYAQGFLIHRPEPIEMLPTHSDAAIMI